MDKFDEIVTFLDQQENVIENRKSSVGENYNDVKCMEQMSTLMKAFNATERWAVKGKRINKVKRTDKNRRNTESMINKN